MSDAHQFEAFMRDYQNMVYTTAYRLLTDEAEAQDIAQEVFLKAYQRFEELKSSETAGGWLKTVTRNLCLNHLSRHRSRWRLFSELASGREDSGVRDDIENLLPAGDLPDPQLDTEAERLLLAKALESLPYSQRLPLVLFHIEEMSYAEIAKSLKVSLAKVKIDIHRGRMALRRILTAGSEYRMV
jgi:RNA polymerase sigma-70 factor (ECF subfamily)